MSRENIKNLKRQAKDLEDILLGINTNGVENMSDSDTLPKSKAIPPLDYEAIKVEADRKASDIVESIILLYLPEEFVTSENYVYQKMEVDKLIVSNLIVAMISSEHGIKKCLEEIDNGPSRDRSFEVLASLQKSKMEIVKHLATFMVTMENNYKNLKYDWSSSDIKKTNSVTEDQDFLENESKNELGDSQTTKFRGTKSLMTLVQGYVEEAKTKLSNGEYTDISGK